MVYYHFVRVVPLLILAFRSVTCLPTVLIVTTTTTATPSLTYSSCLNSDGKIDSISSNSTEIHCGIDHYCGDLALSWETRFLGCVTTSKSTAGCASVSYNGNACYMKSTTNKAIENAHILAAKKVLSESSPSPAPSLPLNIACSVSDDQTISIGSDASR